MISLNLPNPPFIFAFQSYYYSQWHIGNIKAKIDNVLEVQSGKKTVETMREGMDETMKRRNMMLMFQNIKSKKLEL
jgi:hypothetical protein